MLSDINCHDKAQDILDEEVITFITFSSDVLQKCLSFCTSEVCQDNIPPRE
jgi:hypothetical protein